MYYKIYLSMGSLGEIKEGSKDRYFQFHIEEIKFVPERTGGRIPSHKKSG